MLKDVFYQNKFTRLFPLLIIGMLLSACNEDGEQVSASQADTKINNNQLEVDDDYVSDEYYNYLVSLTSKFRELHTYASANTLDKNTIKQMALEYVNLTTDNYVSPITKAESEIDSKFSYYVSSSQLCAESYISYAVTEDRVHAEIARDYKDSAVTHLELVVSVLNKYGLE